MASTSQWLEDAVERLRARRGQLVGRARYGLKPARRDRTGIVTDSAAALPVEVFAHPFAAGIRQVALPVMVGEQIHVEGDADLDLELQLALAAGAPVRTSRPAPGAFRAAYADLAQAGCARILSVHLSGELSGTVEAARLAAADAPVPVVVLDSRTAGLALGHAVLDAAVEAGFGRPLDQVAAIAQACADQSSVLFTVPHLEQLRRGGRIGAVPSLLGALLQVRPVLGLQDGSVHLVDRARTSPRALERMVDLARERAAGGPARIAVHEYGDPAGATALAERLQSASATPVPVVPLPAVLAAHLGLGTLAVVLSPLEPVPSTSSSPAQAN